MVLQKPREIAVRILTRHAAAPTFLEELVDRELGPSRLHASDRALVQEICYGCVRWRDTLNWLIDRRVRERPTPALHAVLSVGLYQLFWLDRIPDHAAVHATVDVAHKLELGGQTGFVNAVLRNYLRDAEATRAELDNLKQTDPALGWSHPRWLVDRWNAVLGQDSTRALLAWNNTPASVYARVNSLKTDPGKLIAAWRTEGVDYDFARYDWTPENLLFRLRRHPPLTKLKSLTDGWFYVQDPSTLMAVAMLDPQPGEEVLDFCAAPGGKATYIAQRLDNDGVVVASEPDARRRQRLQENCQRLAADVTVVDPADPRAEGPFDAILLDAPCSNSGVFRRRVDARWRLTPEELARCTRQQLELYDLALQRVRPGGRIVYSTCSLEPEENEILVQAIVDTHPGTKVEASRQLHPVRDQVDGAFAARLRVPANPSPRKR
ncbi:MAG: 16S rRNA (cytosine(967)-C(5))-methyltransferase RsmB [Verrucomicrobiales bacterium]|nr:16S rRNA (cytosine(967)-C(5))-methyltransferase RsmB [Verrucomicrobiales bacterium]